MILHKALLFIAAAAALAAAAAVGVVAIAFTIYALAREWVGPAGASAVVVGVVALLFLILGLIAAFRVFRPKPQPGLGDHIADFVRTKPLASAIGLLAGGLFAIRSPQVLLTLLMAFLEPRSDKK